MYAKITRSLNNCMLLSPIIFQKTINVLQSLIILVSSIVEDQALQTNKTQIQGILEAHPGKTGLTEIIKAEIVTILIVVEALDKILKLDLYHQVFMSTILLGAIMIVTVEVWRHLLAVTFLLLEVNHHLEEEIQQGICLIHQDQSI